MDDRALQRLEFDKVKEKLAACAGSSLGREAALQVVPVTDRETIIRWQRETSEGKRILSREPNLPLGGIKDIRNIIRKASLGAVLEPQDLIDTAENLRASRRLKNFILDRKEAYPLLAEIVNGLWVYRDVEDKINQAILPGGEIADKASPELHRLRSQIRSLQQRVKDKMESYIRSPQYQKYLQDPIITVRDDRYVLPLKNEYRGQFPGIIHDQSASGATLFIEPMAVVEMNNELRQAERKEHQEIIKILTALSAQVSTIAEELSETIATLATLDFIFAKGRYSHELDAGEPEINDRGWLRIISGRHPLIKGKVVPTTITLGKEFDLLVITGPNTGGKTVTLKTAGLFTLMAQAGLHIPAETGSVINIFDRVFADIGDEQSIEQSLSTFSSHMTNIVRILAGITPNSLVLLDELGAGTDPTEGAALAQAILEYLRAMKIHTIATTHYSELKTYALTRERVENAAVEFDLETLRPTYRLLIGQPGYSRAFPIAKRLGLTNDIIEKAQEFLTTEQLELADLIKSMEVSKAKAEREAKEAEKLKAELDRLREDYEKKYREFQEKRESILTKSREESAAMVRQAKREADEIISELKVRAAENDQKVRARAVEQARAKLGNLADAHRETISATVTGGQAPQNVSPGELVFVLRLNQQGQVLSKPNANGEVQVQLGIMKIYLPLADLRKVKENAKTVATASVGRLMSDKTKGISTELDLRGLLVDEALEKVEKYLDDAFLAGLPRISIIHGKGTGALRKAIQDYLNRNSHIKSQRLGQHGEGGMGVTIVDLK